MKRLKVELGERSYDIIAGEDFSYLAEAMGEISAPKKILIVTDTNVLPLYGEEVSRILSSAGYDVGIYSFRAGEKEKNLETVSKICAACLENGLDRKSMIAALGGGVCGDMAGFAAAIYMRGIDFIQIPTTLLAQSDSSVGGKTGVDFMGAKNILGSFHQPKLVYINTSVLKTLPRREFICGMGEVIKHALIRDREFYDFLFENHERIKELSPGILCDMAYTNCLIKADIVKADEFENGIRAYLNFGHTTGHAIEAAAGYDISHGECVALGMIAASFISYKRGILKKEELIGTEELIRLYGARTRIKTDNADKIYELMQKDKKKSEGKLKFILPKTVGEVFSADDVSREEIYDAIRYINE